MSIGLIYALNKTIHPEWLAQDIDEIIDTLIKCRSEDIKDILEDTQNKLLIDTISRFKIDAVKEYLDLYESINQKEEKKIKKAIKLHLYNNRKNGSINLQPPDCRNIRQHQYKLREILSSVRLSQFVAHDPRIGLSRSNDGRHQLSQEKRFWHPAPRI